MLSAGIPVDQLAEPVKRGLLGLLPIAILRAGLRPQSGLRANAVSVPEFAPTAERIQWFRADFHTLFLFARRLVLRTFTALTLVASRWKREHYLCQARWHEFLQKCRTICGDEHRRFEERRLADSGSSGCSNLLSQNDLTPATSDHFTL
jgi:hypothetical protein